MSESSPQELTELLLAWSNGDRSALEQLMPLVYRELQRLAHGYMDREHLGHTLQTTALVNEVYLRLIDVRRVSLQGRAQFFALAAQLMRRVLVDFARERLAQKRGGGAAQVSFDEGFVFSPERSAEMVALDEALKALAAVDRRKGEVVELRFFGGLSVEETAAALKISPDTVRRDWKFAKVWLSREMQRERRS
jgi:RNA polymerase sigma factor (TIGR02999 family)